MQVSGWMMKQLKTVVLSVFLLAGCGSSDGGKPDDSPLVPVSGVVTLDDEPLANASVQFFPVAGSAAGLPAYGTTDITGRFDLQNARGRSGCEPGAYTVVVSKFAQKDGTPIPADAGGDVAAALGHEHVPAKYSDPQKSQLQITIPDAGRDDVELPLTTKKK